MAENQEFIAEFLIEAAENLDQLDQDLIALEADPQNPERLASIFRTVHTIKGTCGFFGFTKLSSLTHHGEHLLGRLRDGHLAFNDALASLLPLSFTMTRWGDEYYGGCGIEAEESEEAREGMEMGELAVWPEGEALCIFFGPTPISESGEPRAISPVNPVGLLLDDPEPLKELGESIDVRIEID